MGRLDGKVAGITGAASLLAHWPFLADLSTENH